MASKTIGVLALQGDFEAHRKALERAGARAVEVRSPAELEQVAGLVIPGGESTTMLKLLHAGHLLEPLREFGARRPIFGTCAGAILLAARVTHPEQESLGLMDMDVERNAYGRQLDEPRGAARTPRAGRWRRSSSGRPSSGGSERACACWRSTTATRCWWSRDSTWRPRFIPN